jgi:hypothetical protein
MEAITSFCGFQGQMNTQAWGWGWGWGQIEHNKQK